MQFLVPCLLKFIHLQCIKNITPNKTNCKSRIFSSTMLMFVQNISGFCEHQTFQWQLLCSPKHVHISLMSYKGGSIQE